MPTVCYPFSWKLLRAHASNHSGQHGFEAVALASSLIGYPGMKRPVIDFLVEYDDEAILAELRRIAQETGSDTVTKAQIKKFGRISHSAVVRRFGSLRHALARAGLKSDRFTKATDNELHAILIELWEQVLEKEGRTPQGDDLKAYGFPVSDDTVKRRFGGWRKALMRAYESINEDSFSVAHPTPAPESPSRQRQALSIRKRFFVMKRDQFACVRCGASGAGVKLEVHHRFPFAKGGSDNLTNLETLCHACNRGQRDTVVESPVRRGDRIVRSLLHCICRLLARTHRAGPTVEVSALGA